MLKEFNSIFEDVCRYCELNNHRSPSYQWVVKEALMTLAQYPSGLTMAVMITVLEQKWRDAVRRGEHSGKLWGVLNNQQLESSDVLEGNLALIQGDSFRGRLWSSGSTLHEDEEKSKIDVIMHRQHADFYSFCKTHGYPLLVSGGKGRPVLLTNGRLLKGKPPLLLPTAYMCYMLDVDKDVGFLQSVIAPKHKEFYSNICLSKGGHDPLPPQNPVYNDIFVNKRNERVQDTSTNACF